MSNEPVRKRLTVQSGRRGALGAGDVQAALQRMQAAVSDAARTAARRAGRDDRGDRERPPGGADRQRPRRAAERPGGADRAPLGASSAVPQRAADAAATCGASTLRETSASGCAVDEQAFLDALRDDPCAEMARRRRAAAPQAEPDRVPTVSGGGVPSSAATRRRASRNRAASAKRPPSRCSRRWSRSSPRRCAAPARLKLPLQAHARRNRAGRHRSRGAAAGRRPAEPEPVEPPSRSASPSRRPRRAIHSAGEDRTGPDPSRLRRPNPGFARTMRTLSPSRLRLPDRRRRPSRMPDIDLLVNFARTTRAVPAAGDRHGGDFRAPR